jgi:hypothetical protein
VTRLRRGIVLAAVLAPLAVQADPTTPDLTRSQVMRPDAAALERAPAAFPFADWDALLSKYVDDQGRVDYPALAGADRPTFEGIFAAVAASSPEAQPARYPTRAAQEAYYLNAYNVLVWKYVLSRPGTLRNIHEVADAFFSITKFVVGGRETNLNDLEGLVIRPQFKDPRVHMALNCASGGCPRLPRHAFTPDRLEAQLDAETRRFLAEKRNVDYDSTTKRVRLSKLFDWFKDDFGGAPAKVLGWINQYRSPNAHLPLDAKLEYIEYDWRLNDRMLHR